MEKRICTRCKEEKPIKEFVFIARSGNYANYCLECNKKYHKEYYERRKKENAGKLAEMDLNETKLCNKCGQEKPVTEFSFDDANGKFINICKVCKAAVTRKYYRENSAERKAYAKEYAAKNQEKVRARRKKYYEEHAEQARAYSRQYEKDHWEEVRKKSKIYRETHKEEIRERDRKYVETHKEQIREKKKQYALEHADQIREHSKKYRAEHAEEISARRREYGKKNRKRITRYYLNKRATDPLFKLSTQVRGLIRISLKKRGYGKDTHTYEILGCDYETLWEHLKQTWLKNYGAEYNGEPYHIDHIKPLADAKTEQEVKRLCHYTNLQLLKPRDNLVKNKYSDWGS